MVMSLESGAQEETGEVRTEDNREPELTRPKITDREKELAAEASASYNSGDFSGCLATLEKLEVAVVLCNMKHKSLYLPIAGYEANRPGAGSQ